MATDIKFSKNLLFSAGSFLLDLILTNFLASPFYLLTRANFYLSVIDRFSIMSFLVTFIFILIQSFFYFNLFYFSILELLWLSFSVILIRSINSIISRSFLSSFVILSFCLICHYFVTGLI